MKTLYALLTLGAAFTINSAIAGESGSCCSATTAALSPRASASQTYIVAGKTDADFARADLGTGARAKASGGRTANFAGTVAKDVDLVRGSNNLGVAARAKATGNTGTAMIEIAPLK